MNAPDPGGGPAVYSVAEVVELFGGRRHRSAVYEDLRRGAIPSLRLGRRLFVPGWYVEQLRNGDRGEQPVISRLSTSADDLSIRERTQ